MVDLNRKITLKNLNPKKQVKPVGDMGSNRWGTWAGLQIREQTAIKGDELRGLLVRAHLGSRQLPARQWSVSVERFQETQSRWRSWQDCGREEVGPS